MKYMRFLGSALLVLMLIQSCASFKAEQQAAAISFPQLGSIIKTKGSLWYATSEQVGAPQWDTPLKVTVQQLPFNKSTYGEYAHYMRQAQKVNSIPYVDSLAYKPKYLRLQLLDQIGLSQLLNADQNDQLRSYLEADSDYKIVTGLKLTTVDALMPILKDAQMVLLEQDDLKNQQLTVISGDQERQIDMVELQVFGIDYATFCWGEDRYHNKQIKVLTSDGQGCPKGSHKKAAKATADRSYLKL